MNDSFLGSTILVQEFSPTLTDPVITPELVFVGDTIDEFTGFPPANEILDITENGIFIQNTFNGSNALNSGEFNGWVFVDVFDQLAPFENVTVNSETTLGIDESNIEFSENYIFLNVEGLRFDPPGYVIGLDVEFGDI